MRSLAEKQEHANQVRAVCHDAAMVRAAWPTGDWPEQPPVVLTHDERSSLESAVAILARSRKARREALKAQEQAAEAWRESAEGKRRTGQRASQAAARMAKVRAARLSPKAEAAALRERVRRARKARAERI